MKKSVIVVVVAFLAIICMSPWVVRALRNLAIRPVIESAPIEDRSSGEAERKDSFVPVAGVYISEKFKMKVILTESGELSFNECGSWTELGRKTYVIENDTLTFATDGGQYYIDFLDPDPQIMTLSRRLKPFVKPPQRDYIQLRKTLDK